MRTTVYMVAVLIGLAVGLYAANTMPTTGWKGTVRQLVTLILSVCVVLWALWVYRLVIGPLTLRPVISQPSTR